VRGLRWELCGPAYPMNVMPGLEPGIHAELRGKD
jgi:hypothetical protein